MTDTPGFDSVLEISPPAYSREEAVDIADELFGVAAMSATSLGSERDQTFLLQDRTGAGQAVMKISNSAEDPSTLDMEALAAQHIRLADPGLPVAIPWLVPGAIDEVAPDSYRAALRREGVVNWVRMYDLLPGTGRGEAVGLSDAAVSAWGKTTARLGRSLRSFFHPKAQRTMLWDVQNTLHCRVMLDDIRDTELRATVSRVFDHFETDVLPRWRGVRGQIVHGDLTLDNVLIDDQGFISGVIDFGDMSYSALAIDLAAVLDSLADGREGDELFRAARVLLDGYQRVTPLEPTELSMLGELWAARCAVTIAISSWRSARGLEDQDFAERYNHVSAATIESFLSLGFPEVTRRLGGAATPGDPTALVARREKVLGPAIEPLTYDEPIHLASAHGVQMTAVDGSTYLDAYNNVPCVGHTHPRVTEAIARQSRVLNTNMRYLHDSAIELAERLAGFCEDPLDTVMFVNSGSEANDLAWRLAVSYTGNRGGLCTDFAYHGISDVIAALSPESWEGHRKPDHVETWTPPDTYRRLNSDSASFTSALDRMRANGLAPAVAILDGVLTSDGFYDLDPTYVQALVAHTREAGGLWIADEVQGGHGRTGDAMWSYQRFGITPDFVTLGKPMGNGHPVAAVITRREIAESFADDTVFFSTFGGNPVSVVAAHAVLDVLADERVLPRTQRAGDALRAAVRDVASRHPLIGDVRGMGLANGIEIVSDPDSKEPAPDIADAIKEGMRRRHVLVGSCGRRGNILKVRPPLAFTAEDVPAFVTALEQSMADVAT